MKKINKILMGLLCSVTEIEVPFAFSELKGPFLSRYENGSKKERTVSFVGQKFKKYERPKGEMGQFRDRFPYLYLYDTHTYSSFICISENPRHLHISRNFFGDEVNPYHIGENLGFYYIRAKFDLIHDESQELFDGSRAIEENLKLYASRMDDSSKRFFTNIGIIHEYTYTDSLDVQLFPIKKEFIISSGVLIKNSEDKVQIGIKNVFLDFQNCLIEYFNKTFEKNLDLLNKAVVNVNYSDSKDQSKTQSLSGPEICKGGRIVRDYDQRIESIKRSKILNVFAVIKDENGVDSIIWGFAENINTGKKFHWVTKLEDDLSALYNKNH